MLNKKKFKTYENEDVQGHFFFIKTDKRLSSDADVPKLILCVASMVTSPTLK